MRERGVCVVIPTYNNGGTIAQVVADALVYCADVIVVDDGSTDQAPSVLRSLDGITLVTLDRNRGKGHALRAGFRRALDMGFAYAITMDGDGQHYAREIPRFLEANRQHPGALIVGCRRMDGVQRSSGSRFANRFANFWFWFQTGLRGIDTQCGQRLYPLRHLHGLALLASRYEAELELLVFTSWHGTRVVSLPIDVYYPPVGERVSHFRPAYDFCRIFALNSCLFILTFIYGLPLRLWWWVARIGRTLSTAFIFSFFSLVVISPYVWVYTHVHRMTEERRMHLHKIIMFVARTLMRYNIIVGTRFSYRVEEGVAFDKPRIIICNHQCYFDLMCMLVFTPRMVFLTNDWVWNSPYFGHLIRSAEYLHASDGFDKHMDRFADLVSRGYSIAIFPEGTRSQDCHIQRFHQGAFKLAADLGLDILPMLLYGPGRVLPKHHRLIHRGRMHVEARQPLTRQWLDSLGTPLEQAKAVRHLYIREYEKLSNRMDQDA